MDENLFPHPDCKELTKEYFHAFEDWKTRPGATEEFRECTAGFLEVIVGKRNQDQKQKPTRRRESTDTFPETCRFTGDNIHRATFAAFARARDWHDGEGYFKGLQQEYKNLKITVYLPNGDKAASLWEFLQRVALLW